MESFHTCADLVCLYGRNRIYVCNPSTEEFVMIPKASLETIYDRYAVGFGYSSSSKAYKVVNLFKYYSDDENIHDQQIGCEVFTIGCADSSWRRVEDCPYDISGLCPQPFVEGSLHWLMTGDSVDEVIVSFNLEREEFRVISHPEFLSRSYCRRRVFRLVELRGCLCLIDYIQPCKYDILMLKDYKNHIWVKEYTFDIPVSDYYYYISYPRAIRSDGAILMETPYRSLDYYGPKSGTFTKVDEIKVEKWFQFSYYVESFYSLGSR